MFRGLFNRWLHRKQIQRRQDPAWQSAIDFRPRMELLEDRSMMAVANIVATDNTATELSQATGTFTITLDSPASGNVTVNIALSGTTSTDDFAESGTTSVVVPDGETEATLTITPALDNLVESGGETVIGTLASGTGYTVGPNDTDTVTIADDPPVVSIERDGSDAFGEAGENEVSFIISRTGGNHNAGFEILLDFGGTADGVDDFQTAVPTEFMLTNNEYDTLTLNIRSDNLVEGNESGLVTVVSDEEHYLVDTEEDSASFTIVDDPPVVSISASEVAVVEGGAAFIVTVSRTGGDLAQALNVLLDFSGTADPEEDLYCALGQPPTEIPILANESEAYFTVYVSRDNLVEGTETAVFEIAADSEHYVIDEEAESASIDFLDDAPTLTIGVIDGLVASEDAGYSGGMGAFLVQRSGGDLSQPLEFSFNLVTMAGTYLESFYATPGVDYEAPESLNVSFDADDSTWEFAFTPIDDSLIERNEWVWLELETDPDHFVIDGSLSAYISIDDNEKASGEAVAMANLRNKDEDRSGSIEKTGAFVMDTADGVLRYNSSLDGRAIVSVPAAFEYSAAPRETILATLTFGELDPVLVYYNPTGLTLYADYQFALPVDAGSLPTGRYPWTLEIVETFDGAANRTRTYSGNHELNNLRDSIYGSGWTPTVVDRLAIQTDGVSWVRGSGTQIWFHDNEDGTFATQAGDPLRSVLTFDDIAETYSLVTRSGLNLLFDVDGLHVSTEDRFGNQTVYTYIDADSDSETDDIETITDPAGRELTFSYTAGFLSGLTDFAGRFTAIEIVDGELRSVTGPDPDDEGELESGVSEFVYADGLLAAFTIPSGSETTLAFDHAGGLASRTNASDDTRYFTNELTAGVVDTTGGYGGEGDPADLIPALTLVGSQTNELDETVTYRTDTFGGRTSETNDLDESTQYVRNPDGQVTLITPPSGSGTFDFQELVYENGNLAVVRNIEGSAFGLITEYEYDETWTDVVVSIMQYAGGASPAEPLSWTLHTLDETTGAVLETRRVQGEVDDEINEETDDAVETFAYTAAPSVSGDPPAGLLASYTNPNGIITLYDYNERGLVIEITLAAGTADEATLGFEYDSSDNLTAEIDELGHRTEHTYDLNRNRLTTTLPDPDGAGPLESPVYTWQYNVMNKVTLAIDPLNRETEFVYGAFGNLVEQTLSGAGFDPVTLSWTYDDAGRNISSTDGLSRTTSYALDALGRTMTTTLPDPDGAGELEAPVFAQTYSSLGAVDSTTDALGNVTSVDVSNYGRTITTTLADPDGEGPLESPVYVQHFDLLGRLVEEVSPTGGVTTYAYNMLWQLVEKMLPDADGPLEEYDPTVLSYSYDPVGNLITFIDGNLATTAYVYDARDRLVEVYLPDAVTGEPVETASVTYVFDAAGQLLSETDPLGRITQHEYDALGRRTALILNDPDSAGPLASPEYHYSYDAASRLILEVAPNGGETEYEYDLLDNVVLVRLADPDGEGGASRPEYTYVFDAASQLLSETDPLGNTTLHTRDNLGREIETETEDPDGAGPLEPSVWQFQFDAMSNLVLSIDPLTNETAQQFDHLHRRTKIIDALSGETSFTFDDASNLLSLTDPIGNTTSWFYDALNRVIEEENELEDSRFYVYDAMNVLIEKTDRNGRVTQYVPDLRGRIVEEKWLNGETVVNTIAYTFNAASQLTAATDEYSGFAFDYDGLGRVLEETQTLTGLTPEIVLSSTWDEMNNRLSLAATIGEDADFENSYTFDALNRMTQVIQAGQSGGNAVAVKRIDMGYNALGQFATLDRYQSEDTSEFVATTTYGYDNAKRLLSLYHEQGETVLAGYTFVQDALGRITEIDSEIDGLSTFTYDATNQVTAADHTGQADEARDWDANGNPEGVAFDVGANNRLLEDALFLYEQDAEGNLTKRTTKATGDYVVFDWDHRNRLAKVSFYDSEDTLLQTIDYAYDVSNRWIRRTLDEDGPGGTSAVDRFFAGYDGLDATLQFDGPAATDLSNRYLWGAQVDQLLAVENVESLIAEGDVKWPFLDHLGTAKDIGTYNSTTNETSIANHRVYNASGLLISETNSSVILVFSFTGKPLDSATGFVQFVFRWYDPHTGRFASEDPSSFGGDDANLLRYVGNNPLSRIDPLGLEWYDIFDAEKNGLNKTLSKMNPLNWDIVTGANSKETAKEQWARINAENARTERESLIPTAKRMGLPEGDELKPMEAAHYLLDATGVVDPTPLSDGINAALYLTEGDVVNAGISGVAIVPIIGDAGKIGKYGARAAGAADEVVAGVKAATHTPGAEQALKQSDQLPILDAGPHFTGKEPVCFVAGTLVLLDESLPTQFQSEVVMIPETSVSTIQVAIGAALCATGLFLDASVRRRRARRSCQVDSCRQVNEPSQAVTELSRAFSANMGSPESFLTLYRTEMRNDLVDSNSTSERAPQYTSRLRPISVATWQMAITAALFAIAVLIGRTWLSGGTDGSPWGRNEVAISTSLQPIETISVGQRVLTHDRREVSGDLSPSLVNIDTWRHLRIQAENRWADGTPDVIEIETLQPPEWIQTHAAIVGATVPLPVDLHEMGLPTSLVGRVVSNDPCPALRPGKGKVVLTTVNHMSNDVWELTVVSQDGAIQFIKPTGFHKFFSATRNDWVSTKDLRRGEHLQGAFGTVTVEGTREISGVQRVYNMTVEAEHVYRVSELGILVHNNDCAAVKLDRNGRWHDAQGRFTQAPASLPNVPDGATLVGRGPDGWIIRFDDPPQLGPFIPNPNGVNIPTPPPLPPGFPRIFTPKK